MNIAFYAVTIGTIFMSGFATLADLFNAEFVLKTSREVGVSRSWLPVLAALKGAGAIGVFAGVFGVPIIGFAAAAGLAMYFIGAAAARIRARAFYNIAFPALFLCLALASTMMFLLRAR